MVAGAAAVASPEARARARGILGDVFAAEVRELEEIEAERADAVRRGDELREELEAAAEDLAGVRSALAALPAELQRAQLEADHLAEAEIQERHHRLSAQREAADARYVAAKREHDRGAPTPLQAAQRTSRHAWEVKGRVEALAPAIAEELKTAAAPVLAGSRRASQLAQTLQSYR